MNIIFLGAPGAGKGTQAEIVEKRFNIPSVSTGNMIREALANGTEMGKKAKEFMEKGQLVPDEVVIGIIKERLIQKDTQKGFILDGFPRTISQAQALSDMGVIIDKVINIEVDDQRIIDRMSGRRVCTKCGASYHMVYKKPLKADICDSCNSPLMIRKDDNADTVANRLQVYHDQTEPLKEFYKDNGKLLNVNGVGEVSEISDKIIKLLEE